MPTCINTILKLESRLQSLLRAVLARNPTNSFAVELGAMLLVDYGNVAQVVCYICCTYLCSAVYVCMYLCTYVCMHVIGDCDDMIQRFFLCALVRACTCVHVLKRRMHVLGVFINVPWLCTN
jgi:hypothetical protein